jgi:hypothetical protein
VCLAGNEFPQGTLFYLLRLSVTERNAKGAKDFRLRRKGRKIFYKMKKTSAPGSRRALVFCVTA